MPGSLDAPQGRDGMHRRLIAGAAGKAVGLVIVFGEQFFLVPVFLHFWGPAQYGDWLALLSTAGLVGLADLGLQTYYANALHRARARGEVADFDRLLRHAAALYGAVVLAMGALVVLAAPAADWRDLLNLSGHRGPFSSVVMMLAFYFILILPVGLAISIYRAHGDFAIAIGAGNVLKLLLIATVAGSLLSGAGLRGLAVAYIGVAAVGWTGLLWHLRRRYGKIFAGLAWPDSAALRQTMMTAPLYAVVPLAMALAIHGTVILIAALAGGGALVVLYTTTRTLTGIARMATAEILQVAGVEIARQLAQEDGEAGQRLYRFMTRFAGGSCGAFAGLIAVIGPPFLEIWTLGRIAFEPAVFWPLLAAAAVAGPSIAGSAVLHFINRPQGLATGHILAGGLVLLLSVALIPNFGAVGAAWAVFAGEAAALSVVVPWKAAGIIGLHAGTHIAAGHARAAAGFVTGWAAAWLAVEVTGAGSLPAIVGSGALWAVFVAGPLFLLLFDTGQRRWFADRLRGRFGAPQ